MKTKRIVSGQSGIVMPLAMVMIVLIGVMGAGLMVFVVGDLRTVLEVNQGQKAMEMAEAGVKIAKIQLQDKPDLRNYDAAGDVWYDGKSISIDSYTTQVTIRPAQNSTVAQPYFAVTSESTIGQTKRKVQAVFKAAGWGIKAYYTPGSIFISPDDSRVDSSGTNRESLASQLQDRIDIRGVSLFAGRDVVISDNKSVTYRRANGSGTRTDSTTGGGLVFNSEYYCIYEDDSASTNGFNYESYFRSNNSSRCQTHFSNAFDSAGEYDIDDFNGLSSGTARFPSAWEKYNATNIVQPHIRIVANAECPEINNQWSNSIASPNVHADTLDDWNRPPYNTVSRAQDPSQTYTNPDQNSSTPAPCQDYLGETETADFGLEPYPSGAELYQPASVAAEGLICRASQATTSPKTYTDKYIFTDPVSGKRQLKPSPVNSGIGCQNSAASIASFRVGDVRGGAGRIGYDSSTTPRFYDKIDKLPTVGEVEPTASTDAAGTSYANDLAYPFDPAQGPDIPGLKDLADDQSRYVNLDTDTLNASKWASLYPTANRNHATVVFIDANGRDIELPNDGQPKKGILVVRCGNLTNMDAFSGIILTLRSTGPGDTAATCNKEGNYRSSKPRRGASSPTDVNGYVYAEGYGDNTSADVNPADGVPDFRYAITIADASDIDRLPRNDSFQDLPEIVGGGIQGVRLYSWRECYNEACTQ